MTGRVCPVHGEYAESGVCRWCEPFVEQALRAVQPEPAWVETYGESPGASALRDATELAQYIALFPAAQEHLLALEHAALRWERVARRWNYKHRSWLNEAARARVWMHWLDQMEWRYAYLTWTPRQPP